MAPIFRDPWEGDGQAQSTIRNLAERFFLDPAERPESRPIEEKIVNEIGPRARKSRYLNSEDFLTICDWKSKRPSSRYRRNSEENIKAATGVAFTTENEMLRIGVLTLLDGVGWSIAAALLHVCHRDRYPMLDERVIRLLTGDANLLQRLPYADYPDFWQELTRFCRQLADRHQVDMRTLDRALFQLDRETNGKLGQPTA